MSDKECGLIDLFIRLLKYGIKCTETKTGINYQVGFFKVTKNEDGSASGRYFLTKFSQNLALWMYTCAEIQSQIPHIKKTRQHAA